jgi:alanine racemase
MIETTSVEMSAAFGATLKVDLSALQQNYRSLRGRIVGSGQCGAVVKADAYGLGALKIAPALYAAGCRDFFAATLDEALALRRRLPAGSRIYILNGLLKGIESECADHDLLPVLNTAGQIERWTAEARRRQRMLPAVVQFDTGMSRFGLSESEAIRLADEHATARRAIDIRFVMSHLACADEALHEANRYQLSRFSDLASRFPGVRCSLANSSGIFLGPDFHSDLVRPGAALYGLNPVPGKPNPMKQVVTLTAKVAQLREVKPGDYVGYGRTYMTPQRAKLATVAIGYADGIFRTLGNQGAVYIDGRRLPIVGRVSMDSMSVDLGPLGDHAPDDIQNVEVIGSHQSADDVAAAFGTIGYEILTALGSRFQRTYVMNDGADSGANRERNA